MAFLINSNGVAPQQQQKQHTYTHSITLQGNAKLRLLIYMAL